MNAPEQHHGHELVPIFIDKQKRESPENTSGQALYALGPVLSGFDLFLDANGPKPDQLIVNDLTPVQVKAGAKYYTVKQNLNPGHA